jgi:hypothetical protein
MYEKERTGIEHDFHIRAGTHYRLTGILQVLKGS